MAPKILDLDHPLSNAEVLHWTRLKREQHAREDAEDLAAGTDPQTRPANFMKMLANTERHLTSDAYPYAKNPSVYGVAGHDDSLQKFLDASHNRIQLPVYERYKNNIRKGLMSIPEAQEKMGEEHEKKELTEPEQLMIFNHAPTNIELLEPMIEEATDRFTKDELQIIVDCSIEFFRAEELKAKRKERKKEKNAAAKEARKQTKEREESAVKDDGGVSNMGDMAEAAREASPFRHRKSITTGVLTDYEAELAVRVARGPEKSEANEQELMRRNRPE